MLLLGSGLGTEELDADEPADLERRAARDGRIALLDAADGRNGGTGPFGELGEGQASLPPAAGDLQAEDLGQFEGRAGVRTSATHAGLSVNVNLHVLLEV